MRESTIEKRLVARVKQMGGEVRKVSWIGRRGAPDRLVMLPARRLTDALDCAWCNPAGVAIWIELKATGKTAEPHQAREHARMRAMGQRVEVVDSFERVDEVLS
ncbi:MULTISPECIES: VRR-NUC domain-containing protein [unclassified Janthinobacterium]|uniref:VRR-NUC domain-containing protein n=1 Tax=unclassified Janthinobacterium TaxID=2610881 RepID=UPI00034DAC23|nr:MULTISPECIES: VRR-NUC domain-containing protein [unclassified Janthinobacterium]MEC5161686.1 hypothetical protein [Janthinobacterium sp. CG_S6]